MRRTAQRWFSRVSERAKFIALFVLVLGVAGLATFTWLDSRSSSVAAQAGKQKPILNYDVRVNDQKGLTALLRTKTAAISSRLQGQRNDLQTGLARLRSVAPRAEIKLSPLTANVEVVRSPEGLTAPAPGVAGPAVPGVLTQATEIFPTIVNMSAVQDLLASPNGWIDDCPVGGCTANETQTIGNNVHAYMDRVGGAVAGGSDQPDTAASSVIDGNGKPTGNPDVNGRNRDFLGTTPRDFQTNYLPPPQGGNPEAGQTATGNGNNGTLPVDQYRRGMLTQLFYVTNWYHDRVFSLGFDEAAGNFQQTNFSGMGLGGDRVLAEGQDSSGTNNANFSTPPPMAKRAACRCSALPGQPLIAMAVWTPRS